VVLHKTYVENTKKNGVLSIHVQMQMQIHGYRYEDILTKIQISYLPLIRISCPSVNQERHVYLSCRTQSWEAV